MAKHLAIVEAIIPSFNRAYCVARAIDSVLGQTHLGCRVILVDDGSTDDTEAMMVARYGGDSRVTYIRQANRGVSGARNTGLAAVTGDYVAFLDSDDTWKPWKIELQLDCMRRLPEVGMIWTDMDAVDSQDVVRQERYLKVMYGAYKRLPSEGLFQKSMLIEGNNSIPSSVLAGASMYWGNIFSQMVLGNLVHTSTVLLTSARAAQVGSFNEALSYSGEDFDFHLRTCVEGPVAFADVSSINYRVGNEDQLTRPEYSIHIARNYLNTILPVIQRYRERISLSKSTLRLTLARAHAWISEESFHSMDLKEARSHAFQSLRRQPSRYRMWLIFAACFFPASILGSLLAAFRRLKRRIVEFSLLSRKS